MAERNVAPLAKTHPDAESRPRFPEPRCIMKRPVPDLPAAGTGLIEVESGFKKYAFQRGAARLYAGDAILGGRNRHRRTNLFHLRNQSALWLHHPAHYLDIEKGDLYRALGVTTAAWAPGIPESGPRRVAQQLGVAPPTVSSGHIAASKLLVLSM